MYSITFKAKPQKDKNWVKIEMVLFQTGYNQVPKVTEVIALKKDWDADAQSFIENSVDNIELNEKLLELKKDYLKFATGCEKEGRAWSPIQWSHHFDPKENQSEPVSGKKKVKVISFAKCIDEIIEEMKTRIRFKNGRKISSKWTARNYHYCKKSLTEFTETKYGRKLSSFYYRDIGEDFIKDFELYLQEKGARNGNKAGLNERLRQLYGIFHYSEKRGVADVNKEVHILFSRRTSHKMGYENTLYHTRGNSYSLIPVSHNYTLYSIRHLYYQ
ncbi:MAG TPA: hypothetical protein DIT04_10125 [Dysgonomonas sp.]|nr:hypothetical protein [Dysgonomonas sp.]